MLETSSIVEKCHTKLNNEYQNDKITIAHGAIRKLPYIVPEMINLEMGITYGGIVEIFESGNGSALS